jgi:UDP-N-acetylmuramate--alanine ligase
MDHFGDMGALHASFARFVAQAPGPKVVCLDDPGAARLAGTATSGTATSGVVTYGTSAEAAYRVSAVDLGATSASFNVSVGGRDLGRFGLGVPGLHNVRDATAALAMAMSIGAEPEAARSALAAFRSVGRRFEMRGARHGITYVDDYAHNPGKVRAALAAARAGGWGRVVAVFQPHRYTRTSALWLEFAGAFVDADVLVVTDIYPAGESPLPGVTGRLIADAVRAARPGLPLQYVEGRPELVQTLRRLLRPGDLCLTMGAGDLTTVPDQLLVGPEEVP